MNTKELLGKRLKLIRESHNLTQEMLAENIGMSSLSISKVERGKNFISAALLEKLCMFYRVEPDYFFKFKLNVNDDSDKKHIIARKLKSLSSVDLDYVYKFVESL